MPPKPKYLASTSLIDAEPYLEPFAQTGDIEGMGTVTSVAVTAPAYMAVNGSPVTTSGTIALDFDDVDDHKFFGGADGTTAGTPPTFRLLATGDLPNNVVTLAKLATQAANTILANATGSAASPTAVALAINQFFARASDDATISVKAISDFAFDLLDDADAAAMRATIGAGSGSGSVTSVDVAVPSYMATSGGPITTSGTITLDFDDVDDNKFFGGSAGVTAGTPPTFRYLVTADIPNNIITLAKLATQAANTILANATSSAAVPTAFPLAVNQFLAMSSEDATIQAKAISDDALAFVAAANDAAMRTELGLGTMAVENVASLPTVTFADEANIATNANAGTQIATAPEQKIGFYGASPVEQPNSTGTLIGFDPGVGDPVLQDSTFTGNSGSEGYTIGDIVMHLKALGLLKT